MPDETSAEQTHSVSYDDNLKTRYRNCLGCCKVFMTKYYELPETTNCWQRLRYQLLFPPHGIVGNGWTMIFTMGFLYAMLWSITGSDMLPGGNFFSLFIVFLFCSIAGIITDMIHLPPLFGMLVGGIVIRNIPSASIAEAINDEWNSTIRSISLTIIMIKAGFALDPAALRRLLWGVVSFALGPNLVEAGVVALVTYFILDFNVLYSFILGFIMPALSPAVIVPGLLHLKDQGYGIDKGIPTLIIAATSLGDVICITGLGIVLGIAFPQGSSIGLAAGKGPIAIVVGIVYGILVGIFLWYIPHSDHNNKIIFRFVLMAFASLFAIFGSTRATIGGAGPLGVLTLAFVSEIKWNTEVDCPIHKKVNQTWGILWEIFQPLLFGLIGLKIHFVEIKPVVYGYAFAIMFIAFATRMLTAIVFTSGNNFNFKEKLFLAITSIPRATVQAAVCGMALEAAKSSQSPHKLIVDAETIVEVSVLTIFVSAPLGAILISLFGSKLLQRTTAIDPGAEQST